MSTDLICARCGAQKSTTDFHQAECLSYWIEKTVPCSVCAGKPLASGKPCICDGIGTEHAEYNGIRKRLVELEIALGYFVNLPPQTSKAYTEVCEMIENIGYVRKETLIEWANSIKELNSDKLSSVGIDDFGDLCDEVQSVKDLMNKFWRIIT